MVTRQGNTGKVKAMGITLEVRRGVDSGRYSVQVIGKLDECPVFSAYTLEDITHLAIIVCASQVRIYLGDNDYSADEYTRKVRYYGYTGDIAIR